MTKLNSLIQLAKECPGLQVSVTLGDLVEANRLLIAEAKHELEQDIADQHAETYISRKKALAVLDVSSSTLWRWERLGYLVSLNVGGKKRYRMSDINRFIGADRYWKEIIHLGKELPNE